MDATRVYEMRRALCPTGKLPPASAALLKELQPQAFVDSGFVSGYLQTNLELGRVLLANLLGLEIHDVALDRYVEVAAKPSPNPNDPNRNPRPNPNPLIPKPLSPPRAVQRYTRYAPRNTHAAPLCAKAAAAHARREQNKAGTSGTRTGSSARGSTSGGSGGKRKRARPIPQPRSSRVPPPGASSPADSDSESVEPVD